MSPTIYQATILKISPQRQITVRFDEGPLVGKTRTFDGKQFFQYSKVVVGEGDRVLASYIKNPRIGESIFIADYYRNDALLILTVLFVLVVLWICRMRGMLSILGMTLSFFVLTKGLLPLIIAGYNPVAVMLGGSLVIIPLTFYVSHGFQKKTTIAVVSTFITLGITGALSVLFVQLARLTGYSAEESLFLQAQGISASVRSILLAGFILGAMGVLDDVTISQVSIVESIQSAKRNLNARELYHRAMVVGRDHISSLVNTLFLVYAGASLPLFLLFYSQNIRFDMVFNQEVVATEIVRTLVSSIGIILAVPLSTLLAARTFANR